VNNVHIITLYILHNKLRCVSSQSSSSCQASQTRRVKCVELCCSTSSTRRTCCVKMWWAKWNLGFTQHVRQTKFNRSLANFYAFVSLSSSL